MRLGRSAFTFVELIVVLVIIAILSTIGFTVYESYLGTGRDTKKIVQMKELQTAFQEYSFREKLPLPDASIQLRVSGATYAYQGYLNEDILKQLSFKANVYDDTTESFPVYLLSTNQKDFQFLTFLEDPASTALLQNGVYATTDLRTLFPKVFGKPLGIVLEQDTNIPLQNIQAIKTLGYYDVVTGTGVISAHLSEQKILQSNKDNLRELLPQNSCKRIMELGYSKGSGEYTISPDGITKVQVYCDMDSDGGGWTLIARSKGGTGNFGWMYALGRPGDTKTTYSLGGQSLNIAFQSFRFHSSNGIIWIQSGLDSRILSGSGVTNEINIARNCKILKNPFNSTAIPCYISFGRANLSDRFCLNTDYGDGAPTSCNGITTNGYVGRNNEGVRGYQATVYVQ